MRDPSEYIISSTQFRDDFRTSSTKNDLHQNFEDNEQHLRPTFAKWLLSTSLGQRNHPELKQSP